MARKKRKKPAAQKPATQKPTAQKPAAQKPAASVRTTSVQKLLLFLFAVALTLAGLLIFEGVLVLFGVGEAARFEDPYVGFEPGRDLFLREGDVYVTSPAKLTFFNPQRFPAKKPPGTLRIFALGGSTTAGRPYDHQVAFPRWLELYLEALDPEGDVEVVNAGAISYASYRVVVLMRELVRYEPDVFVVYTGHNEFLEERSYSDLIDEDPRWRRFRLWLHGLRSAALLRRGIEGWRPDREKGDAGDDVPRVLLESEVRTKLEDWTGLETYEKDEALRRAVVLHYEHNLRQMVRLAEDHGVELVFVLPASNLKDFSPFKSVPDEALSPADVARLETLLRQGRAAFDAGDATTALDRFDAALAIDPEHADAHFRRGRALLARGDAAAATDAFVRAKDLDVAPLRALTEIVEVTRRVAAEADVPAIELPAILAEESRERTGIAAPGDELFLDHVHPDVPVHGWISEAVVAALPVPGGEIDAELRRRVTAEITATIDRRYTAERDLSLAKVLGWSGKLEEAEAPLLRAAEVLGDDVELHLNLGVLYQKTGRPTEALPHLLRAAELEPGAAEAHFNLGVTYGLLNRPAEGIAALERALELQGGDPETRYNLAVLKRQTGDLAAAASALETALAERPGAAEIHRELGLVYRRQGRFDAAATALRRALELDPGDTVARIDLAILRARQERFDEAVGELERAIESDPTNAEAVYNLALVEASRGRPEAAIAAYRRALELAPEHARAANNLGILLASRGDLAAARRFLERAVASDPAYAEAHFNLGVVLDQSGLPADAVAAVGRALELDPDEPRFSRALEMLRGARSGAGDGS